MNAVTKIHDRQAISETEAAQRTISESPLTALTSAAPRQLIELAEQDLIFRHKLEREAHLAIVASAGATVEQVAIELHRLSLHYPDRRLNEREAALVAEDWFDDLDGIPIDILRLAIKRWRTGEKCAFYPKPGEILKLVEGERSMRRALARRAAEVLGVRG